MKIMKIKRTLKMLSLLHLEIYLLLLTYCPSLFLYSIHPHHPRTLELDSNTISMQNMMASDSTNRYNHLWIPLQLIWWEAEQISAFWNEQLVRVNEPPLAKRVFQKPSKLTKLEILLIEPRRGDLPNLQSILYNIGTVYGGTDVALTFFCSKDSSMVVSNMIKEQGWRNIRMIHIGGHFPRIPHYNDMLTSKWFLEYFESTHILITHLDSFILRPIEPYMQEFDQIGSPWPHYTEIVGNGGYALRRVSAMREVLGSRKPHEVGYILPTGYREQNEEAEDTFWARNLKNQPPADQALEFGVEMYSDCERIPTGIHQLDRWKQTFSCSGDYWRYWASRKGSKSNFNFA